MREVAFAALDLVGLAPKAAAEVDRLTLPDRRMLEAARALASRPKLLLLDEVMAGLVLSALTPEARSNVA